jgi:hypothetical protein
MTALSGLTDAELLRHAWAQRDPITSTELEGELLRRLAGAAQQIDDLASVTEAIEKSDFALDEMRELFAVLEECNANDLKTLRQKLERADKWYGIAEEAGDLFQRLTDLTNTTL